jgi:predicted acetyltransferase
MNNGLIVLIEPARDYKLEFLDMVSEYQKAGEKYNRHATAREDFEDYLRKVRADSQSSGLPDGYVPMTDYWMIGDDRVVLGESRLRHYLTPRLEVEGGHIGYSIRPSQRRKGYGTLILALTLERARQLNLRRVRITCDTDNVASARIIEKNGGKLSGQAISQWSGVLISQYWIDLLSTTHR